MNEGGCIRQQMQTVTSDYGIAKEMTVCNSVPIVCFKESFKRFGSFMNATSLWGGSSADLSQLHAWLPMLTLTLTRQRGDTSRPAGAGLYAHVHQHLIICAHMQLHSSGSVFKPKPEPLILSCFIITTRDSF